MAQARFDQIADRARLATLPDGPDEPAAPEAVEAEVQRQLDQDTVSAALIARRSVVQLLLETRGHENGEDAAREPEARLKEELAAIERALAARQEELRRRSAAQLAQESRERSEGRKVELEHAIAARQDLIEECEQELKKNEREVADQTTWMLEIEALQGEMDQLAKIDREITTEMTRLKIEANADQQRVVLYRQAEGPAKGDDL